MGKKKTNNADWCHRTDGKISRKGGKNSRGSQYIWVWSSHLGANSMRKIPGKLDKIKWTPVSSIDTKLGGHVDLNRRRQQISRTHAWNDRGRLTFWFEATIIEFSGSNSDILHWRNWPQWAPIGSRSQRQMLHFVACIYLFFCPCQLIWAEHDVMILMVIVRTPALF